MQPQRALGQMALGLALPQPRGVLAHPLGFQRIQRPTRTLGILHRLADCLLDALRQGLRRQQLGIDLGQAVLQLLQVEHRLLLAVLQLVERQAIQVGDRPRHGGFLFLQHLALQPQQLGRRVLQPLLQRGETLVDRFQALQRRQGRLQGFNITLLGSAWRLALFAAQLGEPSLNGLRVGQRLFGQRHQWQQQAEPQQADGQAGPPDAG